MPIFQTPSTRRLDWAASGADVLGTSDIVLTVQPSPSSRSSSSSRAPWSRGSCNPTPRKAEVKALRVQAHYRLLRRAGSLISRAQSMDALSSQAAIAGYKAVLIAGMHLPKFFPMLTTAAGTIRPSQVLVIGAGVAGLQAIATARRLGAVVEA